MPTYIWARERFAINLDGEFCGNFPGAAAIGGAEDRFVEILPHSGKRCVRFLLDDKLSERDDLFVYDLGGSILIKPVFKSEKDGDFRLIMQKKFSLPPALVTVYSEGGTKITVENQTGVETINVPDGFRDFDAFLFGEHVAVTAGDRPKFAAVFSIGTDVKNIFKKVSMGVEFGETITTIERLGGVEMPTVTCRWEQKDGKFLPTVTDTSFACPWNKSRGEKFTARAFFYRLAYDIPVAEMLSEEMKINESKLSGFIGRIDEILPDFCYENGVCISRKEGGKRLVKKYSVELKDGLICNLTEI